MSTGPLPKPLGFPKCASCAFLYNGAPTICGDCAAQTMRPIADSRCEVCSQTIEPGSRCGNRVCQWPANFRGFTKVDAVAMFSGHLQATLTDFKYKKGKEGWALIFGRLVVGWLETHIAELGDIDLIVGNPTAPDRQPIQHIEAILNAARTEDTLDTWHIPAEPVLVKTRETPKSAGGTWIEKREAARQHAYAIEVRQPVDGKHILLFDDVFTTGTQTFEVAQVLNRAGAASVRGLVLARVPWGS